MDDVIKIVQVFESKVENIQLGENLEKEVESALAILYKNNYKAKDFNVNVNLDKAKANEKKLVQAEN